MKLGAIRTGFVVGVVVGLWHAVWAAFIATGLAQRLIDFILYIHFIDIAVKVESFDLARAGLLVGITFAVGFVIGVVFTLVWNVLHVGADAKEPA